MIRVVFNLLLLAVSWLIPRRRKLVVFGSWCGRQYSDNPKYFLLHLLEYGDCDCVWIGNPEIADRLPKHPRLRFARYGSLKANWAALRARNWFFSQGAGLDISPWALYGGARLYNLWHGLAFKWMGRKASGWREEVPQNALRRCWRWLLAHGLQPKTPYWTTSASDSMTEILCACAPEWFAPDRTLQCGTPRNEYLLRNRDNAELIAVLREKYAKLLGFDPGKKIVLYMPTFRGKGESAKVGLGEIVDGTDAVVIEKHHPLTFVKQTISEVRTKGSVLVPPQVSDLIDNPELYLITDIMIGDYSSAFLDFALLRRPIIHYVYDFEDYTTKDAGLAYDIAKIAGGPLVRTPDELRQTVRRLLDDPRFEPGPELLPLLVYEQGRSCETIQKHAGLS